MKFSNILMMTVQLLCKEHELRRQLKQQLQAGYNVFYASTLKDGIRNFLKNQIDLLVVSLDLEKATDGQWLNKLRREHDLIQGESTVLLIDYQNQFPERKSFLEEHRKFIQDIIFIHPETPQESQIFILKNFIEKNSNFLRYKRNTNLLRQEIESLLPVYHRQNSERDDTDFPLSLDAGFSRPATRTREKLRVASELSTPVLLISEPGNEPEYVAWRIHRMSKRSALPFHSIKLSPGNSKLQEAMLFGYNSDSHAEISPRGDIFHSLNGGTVYIENVHHLDWELQGQVLQALQLYELTTKTESFSRVIFSAPYNLQHYVHNGTFRQDLYYRIHMLPLKLPSLQERQEDLPILIEHYIAWIAGTLRRQITLSSFLKESLSRKQWPGNEKELFHFLYSLISFSDGNHIDVSNLSTPGLEWDKAELYRQQKEVSFFRETQTVQQDLFAEKTSPRSLEDVEKEHILKMLAQNQQNISVTARELGISRKTLYEKLKRYQEIDMEKRA